MPQGLGEPNLAVCDVVHIRPDFVCDRFARFRVSPNRQRIGAMNQQPGAGRSTDDGQLWLSMLVGAMENASRPEHRALPWARSTRPALRAHRAYPATLH